MASRKRERESSQDIAEATAERERIAALFETGDHIIEDDPPLNPALASDPGGWCVHESAWQYGKPVIAQDASGYPLRGLTEAEARFAVRVLGSGYTAAREA